MYKQSQYAVNHYTIRFGVDPEPIWALVQARGGWIRFNRLGQVVFMIDTRLAVNTWFLCAYSTCVEVTEVELWLD
jgi:hypothetical protein